MGRNEEGADVGCWEGAPVGWELVGRAVGWFEGAEGAPVGWFEGAEGSPVGWFEGAEGAPVGRPEGVEVY